MGACELYVEWFKSINPNGKAPAIVHVKEDGTSVTVFESAPVCYTSPADLTKNTNSCTRLELRSIGRSYPGCVPSDAHIPRLFLLSPDIPSLSAFVASCRIIRTYIGSGSLLQVLKYLCIFQGLGWVTK